MLDDGKNPHFYSVRIRVIDGELALIDEQKMVAGMPVEAFIQTVPHQVI